MGVEGEIWLKYASTRPAHDGGGFTNESATALRYTQHFEGDTGDATETTRIPVCFKMFKASLQNFTKCSVQGGYKYKLL